MDPKVSILREQGEYMEPVELNLDELEIVENAKEKENDNDDE